MTDTPKKITVLRKQTMPAPGQRPMTSEDAKKSPLPPNCIVLPMRILDKPEPIKRFQG